MSQLINPNQKSGLKIFSGNSNRGFAEKVAQHAGVNLGYCDIKRFADGEIQVEIHESVRGDSVFVIQSTCPPVNENYMELFLILDALKRASARQITAVLPYYGYARQDRKVAPRAPISAKCMADLITSAGATRIVCVDLHAAQIQGFFNVPVDHLFATPTLARAFREKWGTGEEFLQTPAALSARAPSPNASRLRWRSSINGDQAPMKQRRCT